MVVVQYLETLFQSKSLILFEIINAGNFSFRIIAFFLGWLAIHESKTRS